MRDMSIHVRVSPEEADTLERAARTADRPVAAFVRRAALAAARPIAFPTACLRRPACVGRCVDRDCVHWEVT